MGTERPSMTVSAHEKAPARPAMRGETEPGPALNTERNCSKGESTVACQNCTMTVEYMGPAEVAAYVGRAPQTIRNLAASGAMPEPDVRIGTIGGWSQSTIDEWLANRPGQGARTDLAGSKGTS